MTALDELERTMWDNPDPELLRKLTEHLRAHPKDRARAFVVLGGADFKSLHDRGYAAGIRDMCRS